MFYALNISSTVITVLAVCAAVGVLALTGIIVCIVKIAKHKKENKQVCVSEAQAAPAQQSLSMPVRPQLPAPTDENTATDDPVTDSSEAAEEVAEQTEEPVEEQPVEEVAEEVEEPAAEQTAEEVAEQTEEPVEEQPAEEIAEKVEEPAAEQTAEEVVEQTEESVDEQPAEEVAEEVKEPVKEIEEAPVTATAQDEEEREEEDEGSFEDDAAQTEIPEFVPKVAPEGKILVKVRYNRSYTAKIIQSQDTVKNYYDEVKNELMRYGVSDRISWKHETFKKGRKLLARFAVRGKTLGVYLALNPADYENTKYKVEDVSSVKKNAAVPALYRIKNDRRCHYVKDLIANLMAAEGLEAGEQLNEKYSAQYPYEELEPLIDRKLVKLLPWKDFAAGSEVGLIAVSKDDLPTEILMGEVSVSEADDMFIGGNVDVLVEHSAKYSDKSKKDIINIDTLGRYFNSGETVTVEEIKKRVPDFGKKVTYLKVLARGKLDKSLTVEADDFSPEAIKMIVLTGGKVIRKKANK